MEGLQAQIQEVQRILAAQEVFPGLLSENGKALVRMAGHDKQNGGAFNLKSVPAHCRLCVSESPLFKAYDEGYVKARTEFLQESQEMSPRAQTSLIGKTCTPLGSANTPKDACSGSGRKRPRWHRRRRLAL